MSGNENLKGKTGIEEQKTVGVSPWMLSVIDEFDGKQPQSRWDCKLDVFSFHLLEGKQSLWVTAHYPGGGRLALRAAYCPDAQLEIREVAPKEDMVEVVVGSSIGNFNLRVEVPSASLPIIRCVTTLTPSADLVFPYWPRDLLALGEPREPAKSKGVIYAKQVGPRSGLVYFSLTQPKGGSALYFQNLTSLNDYAEQTNTSLAGTVGGQWPELGMALPPAMEKPLKAGQAVTLSDAFLLLNPEIPADDLEMAWQFIQMMAQIYACLPTPDFEYIHWPELLDKSLKDLSESEKCWTTVDGKRYLNAYVGDFETPPESMVQLSVLLPLLEYQDWSGHEIPITKDILDNLPEFFDKKAGVYGRWLPSKADKLDGSEPHKKPRVMDSWYLYHSLLNLSRLVKRGHKPAHKLFFDSMDYAITVAHKFNYHWPVFYNLDTMEIIKAETKEGEGGETDVAGQYAHVMMQAWDMTKDQRYLDEAKKAAQSLEGLGFNLLYQANATLFSTGAMVRIYNETQDELYLKLSYLCLANVFNQVWLWECNYGYGKYTPNFFALFPLKGAPYTAVYEELEGFAAFHDYLAQMKKDTPEPLKVLIAEFIRVLIHKAAYYYPPNLPEEMIADKPRTGEIAKQMWIPLEDLYDGWQKAGQVGQEVYGAGLPFGLVPRHYFHVPDEDFLIYVNYPTTENDLDEPGQVKFYVRGSQQYRCLMRLIPKSKKPLPEFTVQIEDENGSTKQIIGKQTPDGHLAYELNGGHKVVIRWPAHQGAVKEIIGNKQKGGSNQ